MEESVSDSNFNVQYHAYIWRDHEGVPVQRYANVYLVCFWKSPILSHMGMMEFRVHAGGRGITDPFWWLESKL